MKLSKGFTVRLGKQGSKPKVLKPSPPPVEGLPTERLMLRLMFEGLRVKDERLNAITIELFGRFGDQPIRRLVLEAVSRTNSVSYRLRVLQAIARIGRVCDQASIQDLIWTLLRDRNAKIREAVAVFAETLP